jgi:hypothetical protein
MQKAANIIVRLTISGEDAPANDFATEARLIVHDIFEMIGIEGRTITVRKVEAIEGDFDDAT